MPCERKHVEAIEAACEAHEENDSQDTLCAVEDAINAALAACDQSPWRGMESAPKDGTAVLLHNNSAPGNPSGRMESCDGGNTVVGEWWASGESDRDADGFGDWMCYMDAIEDPRCPFVPTHWMPLPEAPRKDET